VSNDSIEKQFPQISDTNQRDNILAHSLTRSVSVIGKKTPAAGKVSCGLMRHQRHVRLRHRLAENKEGSKPKLGKRTH